MYWSNISVRDQTNSVPNFNQYAPLCRGTQLVCSETCSLFLLKKGKHKQFCCSHLSDILKNRYSKRTLKQPRSLLQNVCGRLATSSTVFAKTIRSFPNYIARGISKCSQRYRRISFGTDFFKVQTFESQWRSQTVPVIIF